MDVASTSKQTFIQLTQMSGLKVKGKSEYGKCQLLSQLTWTSSTAEQNSKYKETLNVTLSRKHD